MAKIAPRGSGNALWLACGGCAVSFAIVSGLFCAFEGIDGSGKSSLVQKLAQHLESTRPAWFSNRFGTIRLLREPTYESPAGRQLREWLKGVHAHGSTNQSRTPEAWLNLFLEDREFNVAHNVLPALRAGDLVLQDRYFYSTAAYQASRQVSSQEIVDRNLARGFPPADLLFYLDIPVEVAAGRIEKSRESAEFFETREQLTKIAEQYNVILPPQTRRLDACLSPDELVRRAAGVLEEHVLSR